MMDIFKKDVYREANDGTRERDWSREAGNAEARQIFWRRAKGGVAVGSILGFGLTLPLLSSGGEPAEAEDKVFDKQPKPKDYESFTLRLGSKVVHCTVSDKRYEVTQGDNLWTIAERHSADVEVATAWLGTMKINTEFLIEPNNYDLIYAEQRLKTVKHCDERIKK